MKITYSDRLREISVDIGIEEAKCLLDHIFNSPTIKAVLESDLFKKYAESLTTNFPVETPEPTVVEHESGSSPEEIKSILTGEKEDAPKEKTGRSRTKSN